MMAAWASQGQRRFGIGQELAVNELEHLPLLALVGHLRIELRGHHQRVLPARIQLQDALKPRFDFAVIQIRNGMLIPGWLSNACSQSVEQLRQRDRVAQAHRAKYGGAGGAGSSSARACGRGCMTANAIWLASASTTSASNRARNDRRGDVASSGSEVPAVQVEQASDQQQAAVDQRLERDQARRQVPVWSTSQAVEVKRSRSGSSHASASTSHARSARLVQSLGASSCEVLKQAHRADAAGEQVECDDEADGRHDLGEGDHAKQRQRATSVSSSARLTAP